MSSKAARRLRLCLGLGLLLCPGVVSGQGVTGAIEGTAKDESGAVIPGVRLELSSPELSGVQTATTDERGYYRFLRLPSGAYTVRFSITGFSSVEHPGIQLTSGQTVRVDASMARGELADTITVVAEQPLLDAASNTIQTVIGTEFLKDIPNSRHHMDLPKLLVGSVQNKADVGGGDVFGDGVNFSVNGSQQQDRTYYRDGMKQNNWFGTGEFTTIDIDSGGLAEFNLQYSALPAQYPNGGIVTTFVSKSAVNTWTVSAYGTYADDNLQSDISQEARDAGIREPAKVKKQYDLDLTVGGPIVKDELTFQLNYRNISFDRYLANSFLADGSQASDLAESQIYGARLMYQINPHHRLSSNFANQRTWRPRRRDFGGYTPTVSFMPDQATSLNESGRSGRPVFTYRVDLIWTGSLGPSWIFEGGIMTKSYGFARYAQADAGPYPIIELATSTLTERARLERSGVYRRNDAFIAVTKLAQWKGSHELKFGFQTDWGWAEERRYSADTFLEFRNGVAESATLLNVPIPGISNLSEYGLYVQDRWRIANKLTLNVGARFDHFYSEVPAQSAPANTWVPARSIEDIKDVPNWNDLVPRLGLTYDVKGNGQTVLKASASKYVLNYAAGISQAVNPLFESTSRCAWRDINGDRRTTQNELSACSGFAAGNTFMDPDMTRPYSWEFTAGIEHQVTDKLALALMYYRRTNDNLFGNFNEAIPTSTYTPITTTNLLDGSPLTIYNQDPRTLGRQRNVWTNTDILENHYNGIDITFRWRFGNGNSVQGGYGYGSKQGNVLGGIPGTTDMNDPNNSQVFPEGAIDFDQPHRFKFVGTFFLPWKISLGAFFTNTSGVPKVPTGSYNRALVPGLTRASQTLRLEKSGDTRYDRIQLLDLRLGRVFRVGNQFRIEPFVDVYNLFNANTVVLEGTIVNSTSYGVATDTLMSRLLKLGMKIDF